MHNYAVWDLPLPAPRQRQGEVDEALLDMLLSFSDFATFKQAILDYRKVSPPPATHPTVHPKQLDTALSVHAGERGAGGGANGLCLFPHIHQTRLLTEHDTPQCIITYGPLLCLCSRVQCAITEHAHLNMSVCADGAAFSV